MITAHIDRNLHIEDLTVTTHTSPDVPPKIVLAGFNTMGTVVVDIGGPDLERVYDAIARVMKKETR